MASNFCNPENINIDFPDTKWTRIGVHYFNQMSPESYDIHPVVKIFCDGDLAAELGTDVFDVIDKDPQLCGEPQYVTGVPWSKTAT